MNTHFASEISIDCNLHLNFSREQIFILFIATHVACIVPLNEGSMEKCLCQKTCYGEALLVSSRCKMYGAHRTCMRGLNRPTCTEAHSKKMPARAFCRLFPSKPNISKRGSNQRIQEASMRSICVWTRVVGSLPNCRCSRRCTGGICISC